MFLMSQPAHLQKMVGHDLSPAERDLARAAFVRDKLIDYR
jgi:protein-arginine kinase